MVAAGSLVPEGTIIPPGTLWLGSPAKFKRVLSNDEKVKAASVAVSYRNFATAYKNEAINSLAIDTP
jgi:carbonic anhydrase/acetyltransferase-like protein (isoleucine patch superfamily)